MGEFEDEWEITIEKESNYLGLRISKDGEGGYWIDQEEYINDAINDLQLNENKKPRTPITPKDLQDIGAEWKFKDEPVMSDNTIRSHVGKLLWLALCTRPDIHQTVSRLAATISLRSKSVHDVRMRIWYYLKDTINYGIHYTTNGTLELEPTTSNNQWELEHRDLIAFTDADHMGCPFSRRLTG